MAHHHFQMPAVEGRGEVTHSFEAHDLAVAGYFHSHAHTSYKEHGSLFTLYGHGPSQNKVFYLVPQEELAVVHGCGAYQKPETILVFENLD